ncbi:O-antigen polymerase [Vibrio sp. 10N.222.55.B11]|uniref:O-antigen polymerase n=1 Tax=Vibrio sp. 10N.222.55.B11 TaxID=3229648 RepID=UPI00354E0A1C
MVSFHRNKDIFSPVKLYSAFNLVFYMDVFFSAYGDMVLVSYFLMCVLLLIFSLIEPPSAHKKINIIKNKVGPSVIFAIWCMSFASIVNQMVVINELGGVVNYIGNLAYRVEYFKGRGYVIIINNIIATMNVIYFAVMLMRREPPKFSWLLFVVHFAIFVFIALLSGSRSFLLMTILVEIMVYHYVRKEFTIFKIAPYIIVLGVSVAVLGTLRNTVSTSEGELKFSSEDEFKLESTHFKYGLIPLDIVFSSEDKPLFYGATYFSLITNFIPRVIYSDKLDTGGVAFTKLYTGDQWGGLSNLSTGSITEGIINFGHSVGLVVGLLTLGAPMYIGLRLYSRLHSITSRGYPYIKVVWYIYFILAISRLSYSEFSYTYFTFVLYYIVPAMFVLFLSVLFKSKKL